tara:strand:- start:4302 stop:5165 length:864 start_codon:yes stop_codon:yes gene_type:complete
MDKAFNWSEFLLNDSLYQELDMNTLEGDEILNLLFYCSDNSHYNKSNVLDSYCPVCEKQTSFVSKEGNKGLLTRILMSQMSSGILGENKLSPILEETGFFERIFQCPRALNNPAHHHIFKLRVYDEKICKIGQYPAIADLAKKEIKKYQKFNKEIYSELNRAIGLITHGIGVGAFVYLRRIIEKHIVAPILDDLVKKGDLKSEDVSNATFQAKIDLAKKSLPQFLVTNTKIYSILSKGIHQLEEEECKEYFPILRSAIEMILNERIKQLEIEKEQKKIEIELNRING